MVVMGRKCSRPPRLSPANAGLLPPAVPLPQASSPLASGGRPGGEDRPILRCRREALASGPLMLCGRPSHCPFDGTAAKSASVPLARSRSDSSRLPTCAPGDHFAEGGAACRAFGAYRRLPFGLVRRSLLPNASSRRCRSRSRSALSIASIAASGVSAGMPGRGPMRAIRQPLQAQNPRIGRSGAEPSPRPPQAARSFRPTPDGH